MVVSQILPDSTVITLSPNRSATWQQTKIVIFVMAFVMMVIALAWTFVGAWVILPFAGLELGLFALLMYKVSKFTYSRQVINIDKNQVTIAWGAKKLEQTHQIQREDLYVYYWEADEGWHLPRISLSQHLTNVEIGKFLNLEDRQQLKDELELAGLIVCRNKWWQ
jgi:uncharacterized membrane protein